MCCFTYVDDCQHNEMIARTLIGILGLETHLICSRCHRLVHILAGKGKIAKLDTDYSTHLTGVSAEQV